MPHVARFNSQASKEKLRIVAKLMGVNLHSLSADEASEKAIESIQSIAIPNGIKELGAKKKI